MCYTFVKDSGPVFYRTHSVPDSGLTGPLLTQTNNFSALLPHIANPDGTVLQLKWRYILDEKKNIVIGYVYRRNLFGSDFQLL